MHITSRKTILTNYSCLALVLKSKPRLKPQRYTDGTSRVLPFPIPLYSIHGLSNCSTACVVTRSSNWYVGRAINFDAHAHCWRKWWPFFNELQRLCSNNLSPAIPKILATPLCHACHYRWTIIVYVKFISLLHHVNSLSLSNHFKKI